jgi:hypothetical protein
MCGGVAASPRNLASFAVAYATKSACRPTLAQGWLATTVNKVQASINLDHPCRSHLPHAAAAGLVDGLEARPVLRRRLRLVPHLVPPRELRPVDAGLRAGRAVLHGVGVRCRRRGVQALPRVAALLLGSRRVVV